MNAKDITALLERYHALPEWVSIAEMRCGTGWGKASEQRIDFWSLNCYPSKRLVRVAYEIKVTRDDFQRELADPAKRRPALMLSNQFYFATPPGLLRPVEIPPECGLVELVTDRERSAMPKDGKGRTGWRSVPCSDYWIREVVPAPVRDTEPPTWKFVASLLRRGLNTVLSQPEGVPLAG